MRTLVWTFAHAVAVFCCLTASENIRAQDDDPSAPSPVAQEVLNLTNLARAEQGLGALKWDPALALAAGRHNQRMRGQPMLSHQYAGEPALVERAASAGAHFAVIAENLAVGPSPAELLREWLQSPPHRANIMDPRLDSIGIAIVQRGSDLYATQDFSHAVSLIDPDQVEQRVASLLLRQGNIAMTSDPVSVRDARETCEMEHGSAGETQPRFIMRWESSSLNQLPMQLTQHLGTGQYTTAAVGACDSFRPQQGFTSYRVAVLLY